MLSPIWNNAHKSAAGRFLRTALLTSALVAGIGMGGALAADINYPSYHWTEPTYGAFLKELKADFEKANPDVKVKDSFIPFGAFNDQMYIDITSGNAPDVLTALDPDFKRYVDADLLEPLDSYIAAAGIKREDFIGPANLAMKDGKIYGIVFVTNPRVLFLNKAMLDGAGLPVPANLDAFSQMLTKLRDPAKQQFGYATAASSGAPDQQFLEYSPMLSSFGAKVFTAGKPTANSPEMVAALTFYKRIFDQNLIPKGVRFEVYRPMFVNAKVASYVAGPFMGGVTAAGNKDTYANMITTPLPFGSGAPVTVTNFLGVPKGAKQKDLAAKLIVSILQDKYQQRAVELIKAIPARKNMIPSSFLAENPWFKTVSDLATVAVSYAPEGAEQYGSDIIKIVGGHVEALLFRGQAPQTTADAMQADLVKFMADKAKK